MADLEGSDDLVDLERAADLSGLSSEVLRLGALRGHLRAERREKDWVTTRRWLHRFLRQRTTSYRATGAKRPLPEGYQMPDGEDPIP